MGDVSKENLINFIKKYKNTNGNLNVHHYDDLCFRLETGGSAGASCWDDSLFR